MKTFRAAYIADDGSSTGGGFLLTSESDKDLPDDELLEIAERAAKECDAGGDIEIGEWRE